ncbi:MAG: glycogen-binding domain-containing protein [Candidatus Eisenbacteria bacterium]|nr:glycogen-binding domain-containing protein [Candidatus Eisenbacteria bacterium]
MPALMDLVMNPIRPLRRALTLGLGLCLAAALALPALAAPEKTAGGIRFTYRDANAGTVSWAGAFNSWNATANPMKKDGDLWSVTLALPPGEQTYKFVVDGQWFADPENSATTGEFGNSVIQVSPSGDLVAQKATSNTAYSPKILVEGRFIALYQSILEPTYSRFELRRPEMDVDLGFGVRFSDALSGRMLMNLNPRNEDAQDFRSRLNFKRGSLTLAQPGFTVYAFDSENLQTWDDPFQLVGGIGQYNHPFGYQRQGFQVRTPQLGFETELLYSDNFEPGGVTFPGFSVARAPLPEFVFESDPTAKALALLATERGTSGFRLGSGQASKVSTTDFGDNGKAFGYGDGNENTFAMRVNRKLGSAWKVGLLGRTDRGFQLGRLVLAEPTGDSVVRVRSGQTIQQWYGLGANSRWQPRPELRVDAEALFGARRLNLVNGSTDEEWRAASITAIGGSGFTKSASATADGSHLTTDESAKYHLGAAWTFANGDITLRGSAERERHRYPAWTQTPIIPAGLSPDDHARVLNVEFQRAQYADPMSLLVNDRSTFALGWDRNWRYYLGREVKTTVDVEFTHFDYDARTAWEYQMWFPTGNFWLESGKAVVGPDRMTVLGQSDVVKLQPSLVVPFAFKRKAEFSWKGNFTGVHLGTQPRYAESVFRLGWDWSRVIRVESDARWVKYDVPELSLTRGYTSVFTDLTYRWAPGIELSLGFGVDPNALDPITNEYAGNGRERYLNARNANGFVAETDYLSLAPQISAAERALMNERRIQLQAIVHF